MTQKNANMDDPDYWMATISTLKKEDWDLRVRISVEGEGTRVGPVANVPNVGVKMALRDAMAKRARAEIGRLAAEQEVKDLKLKLRSKSALTFALGAATIGIGAAIVRFIFT